MAATWSTAFIVLILVSSIVTLPTCLQFGQKWVLPVGLVQSGILIRSMCLLLQSRASQKGTYDMFELDEPNWSEARTIAGRVAPSDLYRILLADSGVNRAVVLGFENQWLMKYRTQKDALGLQGVRRAVPKLGLAGDNGTIGMIQMRSTDPRPTSVFVFSRIGRWCDWPPRSSSMSSATVIEDLPCIRQRPVLFRDRGLRCPGTSETLASRVDWTS